MRGSHRKTRTGCTQCKRRRVKCDERRPSCANCDRNSLLPCSLEFLTPINSSSRSKSIISRSRTITKPSQRRLYPCSSRLSRELSASSFDTQTGELIHHYLTVVSMCINGDRTPGLWRLSILEMSLAHPFLLSGVIAISALHLATLLPSRKYELMNLAMTRECAALPLFRESINNPNADSIHASFAFAGAVVYYMMALPDGLNTGREVDRCRIPNRYDRYPHWFHTIRGQMAFLAKHFDELKKGPFAPLLRCEPVPNYPSDNPDDEHLTKLEGMLQHPPSLDPLASLSSTPPSSCSSPTDLLFQDARKVEICKEALIELRTSLVLTHPSNEALFGEASLRIWAGLISQDFVELIYERDPRALVILAHYCVLLKRNDRVWYIRGLGPGMLRNIWQVLGEEWRCWIQWPMEHPV